MMVISCDNKKNKEVKPDTFVKIYDDKDLSKSYTPYEIKQTDDEGFLIIGGTDIPESDFPGVFIMKTDKDGNIISQQVLTSDYVNPVRSLIKANGNFYFFCMNRLTLQAKLIKLDQSGAYTEVAQMDDIIYPLYTSLNSDNSSFNLLHYNRDDKKTALAKISITGSKTSETSFDIGYGDFDAEQSIIQDLTGHGKRLPFFCGQIGSTYYFNGYYLYTMSLVFFNMGGTTPTSVVQGYKDERAISSLVNVSGNYFAVSRYGYGENQFIPHVTINYNSPSVTSSSDMIGKVMAELEPDAFVYTNKVSVAGVSAIAYGSTTKSKQIGLYFYDENSGSLLGSQHLGFTNPYEIASFTQTSDNGLAILGTTWIAGRYPRTCMFKLSQDELSSTIK
jgi:hypothetical protein